MERLVRLPQDRLAYYGFKIFKTLLPYLGRKWRQGTVGLAVALWAHASAHAHGSGVSREGPLRAHAREQRICGW